MFPRFASKVVKLPVIYVGGKLSVTYRPLITSPYGSSGPGIKGVGQSLGLMTCHYYTVNIS